MTRSEIFNLHGAQWLYCMFNFEGRRVKNGVEEKFTRICVGET